MAIITDLFNAGITPPVGAVVQHNYRKPLSTKGFQLISFKDTDCSKVSYTSDDGGYIEHAVSPSTVGYSTINAIPGFSLNNAKTLAVRFHYSGSVLLYTYDLACVWDDAYTIGFINRYGFWEYFDCTGAIRPRYEGEEKHYISWATGQKTVYALNRRQLFAVNTGWVPQEFRLVIEDLLITPRIVLASGVENYPIVLSNRTIQRQLERNEKVMNYVLDFEFADMAIKPATV